ncbi:hypothetical protein BDP27DRAFT_1440727 [Rhodocollybia butyracea]|uniref:Uncharacterized protein n=1 Tax=Rhodocollybia butyracea TaxID=206335 RepID=A0A9P5P3V4_9AGAR|nr:hypothetical protein BDP27DRAFT_1440727 [Rhodocollybia butyracea]
MGGHQRSQRATRCLYPFIWHIPLSAFKVHWWYFWIKQCHHHHLCSILRLQPAFLFLPDHHPVNSSPHPIPRTGSGRPSSLIALAVVVTNQCNLHSTSSTCPSSFPTPKGSSLGQLD